MKPWLALTQLKREFELILVDVLTGEQKAPAFLARNPLGVVPFLETDHGRNIGESNAMLWYLCEGTPLMPASAEDRAEALQWMFFEQSKLEPNLSPARFFTTILPHQRAAKAAEIDVWQHKARAGLTLLEAHLATRDFMLPCGYSLADIAVFGYVHVMDEAGIALADYPAIGRWISKVQQTPNYAPLSDLARRIQKAA